MECIYCGEQFEIVSHGYRPIRLNRRKLCRSCAVQFPNGTGGIRFETDHARYVQLLMNTTGVVNPRYYDPDWLPKLHR
jgi:hypothetical protein